MKTQQYHRQLAATLLAGVLTGWTLAWFLSGEPLHAREDRKKEPAAFKSGGERSAEILERISQQITTLDQRLARIEKTIVGDAKKGE